MLNKLGNALSAFVFAYAKAHAGALSLAAAMLVSDLAHNGGTVTPSDWKAIVGAAGFGWLLVAITANTRQGVVVPPIPLPPKTGAHAAPPALAQMQDVPPPAA
jgi:hypothetical protein